jgi:AraC-like DNA-binding protein
VKLIIRFFIQGLFCLLICFISVTTIYGQNSDFQHKKDSLLKVISSTKGEEKLKAYRTLTWVNLQFPEEEIDLKLQYINDFIREARKQQNKEYESIAYQNELACLWNSLIFDKFEQKANEYLPFFKKNGFHKNYYDYYRGLLVLYGTSGGDYKRMIEGVKQMYAEAKREDYLYGVIQAASLIADIYKMEKRYDEAEKYYKETIKNALKLIKEEPGQAANYYLVSNGYDGLAEALICQDKINECLSLMPVWKKHTIDFEKTFNYPDPDLRYYYRSYANIYIEKRKYDEAELYCDSLSPIITPMELYFIWNIKTVICENREEYDSAIDWIDKNIDDCTNRGELSYTVHLLKKKAHILSKMGRAEEAYSVSEMAFQRNDSIRLLENNAQLDEIRTQYEVDKHVTEKKLQHSYFISTLVVCIVLAIAFGIRTYYSRKVTKKNHTLAQQIKELATQHEERINEMLVKTSLAPEIENPETIDNDLCVESRMDKLCIAVRNFLFKDKIYRDSTITQDLVIERLGTNRRMFSETMESCLKMQFKDYVNFLRLKDAIQLLERSDLSIEEISDTVGFGTVQNFRRQFSSKYNMAPKDYRNSIKTTVPTA